MSIRRTIGQNFQRFLVLSLIPMSLLGLGGAMAQAYAPLRFFSPDPTRDFEFRNQWALHNSAYGIDINVLPAWQLTTGSRDVVVAVIDSGIAPLPELEGNLWINKIEKNGLPQVDDDSNGFVDDIRGANFINPSRPYYDDHGHGTHVAGIIGARRVNGRGLIGVNQHIRMMNLKYLGSDSRGLMKDAATAIHYALDQGARIINFSSGGSDPFAGNLPSPPALDAALARAEREGVLLVAGAGNEKLNNDHTPFYPASSPYSNIMAVAAIDSRGELYDDERTRSGSNFGPNTVHIAAPGDRILSYTANGDQEYWPGTSMATAYVSGVAALVLSREPELTGQELKERLMQTSRPLRALRKTTISGGTVDAYHALLNIFHEPDPNDPFNWSSVPYEARTPHPYPPNYQERFVFHVPGAKRLSVHFSRFIFERRDKVYILDGEERLVAVMTGHHLEEFSPYVEGDTLILDVQADETLERWGFHVDKIAVDR